MALSNLGQWRLAENITIHGKGIGVDVLQIVSAVAGLASHQRTNAEIISGGVGIYSPRVPSKSRPSAGYSPGETGASGALQLAGDGNGSASRGTHTRAGLPPADKAFHEAIPAFESREV